MSNVVSLCDYIKNKKYETLEWAREYLEEDLYNQALNEWSIEELERTIANAYPAPSFAYEAYSLILKKRVE